MFISLLWLKTYTDPRASYVCGMCAYPQRSIEASSSYLSVNCRYPTIQSCAQPIQYKEAFSTRTGTRPPRLMFTDYSPPDYKECDAHMPYLFIT